MPIRCGITDSRHNLLDLWLPRPVAIPTLPDKVPQGVGDPDSLCIHRFLRAGAMRYVVREFQEFETTKRCLSRQDLAERQEKQADGDCATGIPEV